jgi:diguanylate cyclase
MPQHYHHGLVLISLVVAIVASYTALNLTRRIRQANGTAARAWLLGGGFAMGTGIWAMHFVGMLALHLPIPVIYDLSTTLLSLLIAVIVSTFALHIASRQYVSRRRLATAGIAMGMGICSMHYVGMAAIEITPAIQYDSFWLGASLAIAIAASGAALWIAFTAREGAAWWKYRIVFGAVVMGFAISGMHYAGMAAAQFPVDAASLATAEVDKAWLAGAVTLITLFVLFAALLLSLIEAQAAARTAMIQASLAQAHKSSQAKDEFLAMLGHELRNPLAAISNAIYLLNKSDPRAPTWQFAKDVIARQSTHLRTMVDDLLDVGRAINGKISLDLHALDLDHAAQSAIKSLQAAGKTAKHRVYYRGMPVWVHADKTRIEQVVTNLITNALNNTPEGGRIDVRVRRDDGDALLTVTDTGIGLDPDTAARVFDLFFQANQDMQRSKGGLGIGLTLVQRIVDMHGGSVAVTSDGIGKGATFAIRVQAIAQAQHADTKNDAVVYAPQRRVLIVEDSQDARNSLRTILEMAGHTVMTAEDGPRGLQQLTRAKPDVALIDIGLPSMDGYELARRARSSGSRALLVALTGYGLSDDKNLARQAGFDAHMTKPAAVDSLLALIANTAPVEADIQVEQAEHLKKAI